MIWGGSGPLCNGALGRLLRLPLARRDLELELATPHVDRDAVPGIELAGEHHAGEPGLQQSLNRAAERTGSELWVEARRRQVLYRRISELGLDPLGSEAPADPIQQQSGDLLQLGAGEGLEDDDLVDPVQELGPEGLAEDLHQLVLQHLEGLLATGVRLDAVRAQVAGHDQDGVLE